MVHCELTYDLFCPPYSPVPAQAHYAAMLEQVQYADANGFECVNFWEHHGVPESYLPSPLMAAAAVAAVTRRVYLRTLLVAPFYDPVRLAEDIAVLDLLSAGRVQPLLGAGFVDEEFTMLGKDLGERRRGTDALVPFLRRAWTEDEVELDGRRVRVTPKPVQQPHPPIIMGGMSAAAARAAARLADDFYGRDEHREIYRQECVKLGKPDPGPWPARAAYFMHVTEDPERDWPRLAPFLLTAIGRYFAWTTRSSPSGRPGSNLFDVHSEEELRASPLYRVLTPDECVELFTSLGHESVATLHPGWGGFSPELGWSSLELFVSRVLPRLHPLKAAAPQS
jgi:alkanesulfonate monooxygenase SsuD/methylene tetrahydromethanopterin reductase-like flavin-dependent oxidoreductase (luciferase family)